MIKFSIIVPVYKAELHLSECVESILAQSYKNFEVILIDDGSPDHSGEICDYFAKKDARVKVIHKDNGGVTSARKAGANIADGEYICCVDSDDTIDEHYLSEFAKILENEHSDIVICNYNIFSDKSTPVIMNDRYGKYNLAQIKKEIYPILIQSKSAEYFCTTVWAKAIRKDIFKKYQNLVNDKIYMGEDRAVVIPAILEANSMYLIKDCLYNYRLNSISLTQRKYAFSWEQEKLLVQHMKRIVNSAEYDFKNQYQRWVVHEFFNVAKSQFNDTTRTYFQIKKDILKHWNLDDYHSAIAHARFSNSLSAKAMSIILRYKFIFLLKLINKVKG